MTSPRAGVTNWRIGYIAVLLRHTYNYAQDLRQVLPLPNMLITIIFVNDIVVSQLINIAVYSCRFYKVVWHLCHKQYTFGAGCSTNIQNQRTLHVFGIHLYGLRNLLPSNMSHDEQVTNWLVRLSLAINVTVWCAVWISLRRIYVLV